MVLVITPALAGLRPAWREAAHGLGAGSWTYWRWVGLPVLAPSVLGAILLLVRQRLLGLRHRSGTDQRQRRADPDPDRLVPVRQRDLRPGERRQGARPRDDRHRRRRHDRLRPAAAKGFTMASVAAGGVVDAAAGPGPEVGQRRAPGERPAYLALGRPAADRRLLPGSALCRREFHVARHERAHDHRGLPRHHPPAGLHRRAEAVAAARGRHRRHHARPAGAHGRLPASADCPSCAASSRQSACCPS